MCKYILSTGKLIIDRYLRVITEKLYAVLYHQSLESSRCRDIIYRSRSVLRDLTLNTIYFYLNITNLYTLSFFTAIKIA